jgi:nucleotide-binding universal stress UspA family protein
VKVDRILVPLDGSPLAEMALPKAVALLGDSPGATLVLLRATATRTLPGIDPIEAQLVVVHEAEDYLEHVATRLRHEGVPRVETSVWYSSAAPAIVQAARTRRIDLIVMSTHGRSGLRRVIRGSVAESVLRGTQTPILLVSAGGTRVEDLGRSVTDSRGGRRARSSARHVGKGAAEVAVRSRVLSRGTARGRR